MKKKWMILACVCLLLTACGKSKADQCYEDGIVALENEDYDTAITCFESLIADGEGLPEAYRGYGITWMKMGYYPEAIAAFSRSLNNLDGNHQKFKEDVMFYLAEMRIATGDLEKGIEVYGEILKDNDKNVQAFFLRGKTYLSKGDYANAQKDFDRAVEDSENYNLYINIYQLYAELGMETAGNRYLELALELEPDAGEDYYHRGRIYEYQKLYAQAKESLLTSLQMEYEDAMLLLGRIYLRQDDSASARSMYHEYLNQSEQKAKAYNGLAQCDIYEGDYASALQNIEEGLAICNSDEQQGLLYNEIVVYEYKKEFQIAKEKMAAYLEKYPEDTQAIRENEFLSTR